MRSVVAAGCLLGVLIALGPRCAAEDAVADPGLASAETDEPFDIAAALADLKARSAAGIKPENQEETMALLTKVIMESSKKQEGMMEKLNRITQMAAKKKESEGLMQKMEGMKQQVENMGTINKLADVVGTFGGDGAAAPPPVKFTPPGLEELKAKADEIRGKQDL